ncbi:leucine-rich repeat-containing protein 51 [Holotrichia oblita]|uniref:Leucine-rich repeat-containing protein 51 n=1 Tax=Holotrichia oblita TaxID=644536 RepID=A0ACB9SGV4_HOLOL|nr:leucine-rich repeat-containing protein 51 [Holotrichia oblita]
MKKFVRECAGKKAIVDFHINENTITETSRPVDYSFFQYKQLKPVGVEQARATRLGEPPERGKQDKKFLTKGIWLNNNKLTNIRNMDTLVASVIESPEKLSWVDFSFNYITHIDEIILKFCNLSIIYFHGNRIKEITEVGKLHKLKKLRNITFHGNPISDMNDYRHIIISFLPTIVHLDNRPVLKSERYQPLHPDSIKYMKTLDDVPKVACMQPGEGKNIKSESTPEEIKVTPNEESAGDKEPQLSEKELKIKGAAITPSGNEETSNVVASHGHKGHCRCYFRGKRLR